MNVSYCDTAANHLSEGFRGGSCAFPTPSITPPLSTDSAILRPGQLHRWSCSNLSEARGRVATLSRTASDVLAS